MALREQQNDSPILVPASRWPPRSLLPGQECFTMAESLQPRANGVPNLAKLLCPRLLKQSVVSFFANAPSNLLKTWSNYVLTSALDSSKPGDALLPCTHLLFAAHLSYLTHIHHAIDYSSSSAHPYNPAIFVLVVLVVSRRPSPLHLNPLAALYRSIRLGLPISKQPLAFLL